MRNFRSGNVTVYLYVMELTESLQKNLHLFNKEYKGNLSCGPVRSSLVSIAIVVIASDPLFPNKLAPVGSHILYSTLQIKKTALMALPASKKEEKPRIIPLSSLKRFLGEFCPAKKAINHYKIRVFGSIADNLSYQYVFMQTGLLEVAF